VYHSQVQLVLASASPRRADLLRAAGFVFEVDPADTDESARPGELPADYVARVAMDKTKVVCARHPAAVVIGADTIVVVENEILGKPLNRQDAARMLTRLSGRTHDVLTGIAVVFGAHSVSAVETSHVRMAALTPDEIRWYVSHGEPDDKAGAYAVQGLASRFIEAIDGSYTNVVGLPVARVYRLLLDIGFHDESLSPGYD
jgi:septum formation protein